MLFAAGFARARASGVPLDVGVETTPGPLGQGVATSVGIAVAVVHGEPLGEEEARAAKRFYGWPGHAQFLVPDGVREHFAGGVGRRGGELRQAWEEMLERSTAPRTATSPQWQAGGVGFAVRVLFPLLVRGR